MNDDSYRKERESQAFQKFINYVENLKSNPDFISEIKWFRRYHVKYDSLESIPENGLPLPNNHEEHFNNKLEYDYMMNKEGDDYHNFPEFQKRKWAFEEKYGLNIFGEAFDYLLFYNSVIPMMDMGYARFSDVYDLVSLSNASVGLYEDRKGSDMNTGLFIRSEVAPITPVAIVVNPYMTQRDIIDFIKKTYKTSIEPIQKRYRKKNIKLKDSRKKSSKKQIRNDFIYDNCDLPLAELTSLVASKFGDILDYTYIQKIIKKEKEKRE